MIKPDDPRELAIDLLSRSVCAVQVAAVVADTHGIFGWGWNSVGGGLGEHAEAAVIRRSNRKRLKGASIYIAGQRKRNAKPIYSLPCLDCATLLQRAGIHKVYYSVGSGVWGMNGAKDLV